jgi:hypothetical protein
VDTKWYPIKDTKYCINILGQVITRHGKLLTPNILGGYKGYRLQINGKQKRESLHRLLAFQFVKGFREGLQVNHRDGNKLNNVIDNLEWVTAKQNVRHAHKTGLVKLRPFKLSYEERQQVYTFIDHGGFTYREIGKMYNVNRNTIYHMNVFRRGG